MGGLLQVITKFNQQKPTCPAVFVLNKWDIVCQEHNYQEMESCLNRTRHAISLRWPGLKDWQLITMNARLAAKMQGMGETTEDLHNLCDAITDLLPIGTDSLLLDAVG